MTTVSGIMELWAAHAEGRPVAETTEALRRLRGEVALRSRSSTADVDVLLGCVGEFSAAEWAAWWQLVCGWPYGFPPAPSMTPDRPR
jgi:hypothetical protein